jgi:dTDP-glucose 4,6-dehydratase
VREWIFVEDHISALLHIAAFGKIGKRYCIGSSNEITNLELVEKICRNLDELNLKKDSFSNLIKFVSDRAGHDKRYSIDSSLLRSEMKWKPSTSFDEGLTKTIKWYLENLNWCKKVMKKSTFNGERLGDKYFNK